MSMIETGWGQAVPDPMNPYGFAPGYGKWLYEQEHRDWDFWRDMRMYRILQMLQDRIEVTRRQLDWYRTAHPHWHLARLIPGHEAELAELQRKLAILVGGGDPYAPVP